jgi:menaquinol-cytochrome c reductase iron-sulfur subunit
MSSEPSGPTPGHPPNCQGCSEIRTSRRAALERAGSAALAAAAAGVVLVPGAGFVLTPLLKGGGQAGDFQPLARFGDLTEGEPQSFAVVESRQDAWVRYPEEPVGTVWLVRQPEGSKEPVLALSAECPHLACAITLSPSKAEFYCPCHTSSFALNGERQNKVPPRGMDRLEVEPFDPKDPDAVVRVKFERFRTMTEERIPLG